MYGQNIRFWPTLIMVQTSVYGLQSRGRGFIFQVGSAPGGGLLVLVNADFSADCRFARSALITMSAPQQQHGAAAAESMEEEEEEEEVEEVVMQQQGQTEC